MGLGFRVQGFGGIKVQGLVVWQASHAQLRNLMIVINTDFGFAMDTILVVNMAQARR